jgi:hypothetical protein
VIALGAGDINNMLKGLRARLEGVTEPPPASKEGGP